MQNNVRNSVVVERRKLFWQFQPPRTNRTCPFERQKAFITQVSIEQTAVVLSTARYDRFKAAEAVGETRVVTLPRIFISEQCVGVTNRTLDLRERTIHAGIWTSDAGNGNSDRFDTSEIVSWIVHVK